MAVIVKFAPLVFTKRFSRWVELSACISSLSCPNPIENFPENYQNIPNSSDFELNIQSLRDKLIPENLIRVLKNTADLDSAVKVFKWAALQKRFRNTAGTYFEIILKLGLAGNFEEMESFCQNLVKDKCPGFEQALMELLDRFVLHDRLSEAIRVLANVNFTDYKSSIDAFNLVLGSLVKKKRPFRDVLFVYKEMVKSGVLPDINTLNYLLDSLFENDLIEAAMNQFTRMNKKGCNPNNKTYELVIRGLIEKNRIDEAVLVLGLMIEEDKCKPEPVFYTSIIPVFCRENKIEEGIRLFRMMKLSNFAPDLLTYGSLIECLCNIPSLDDALNLLEEMIKSGLVPGSSIFVYIVEGFCKLGKIDEAMKLLEEKQIFDPLPYNALLHGCCNAGKFFSAKRILEKMSEMNIEDSDSWNILICWLSKNVGIGKASEVLCRMIISSFVPTNDTYSALVIGNCKSGKYEDALKLFLEVRALDSESYSSLIKGLCSVKRAVDATEVFNYMSERRFPLQSTSFDVLIKGICDMGKIEEAIRLRFSAYYSGTSLLTTYYTTIMLELSKSCKNKDVLVVLSQMIVEGQFIDLETYCLLIEIMNSLNRIRDSSLFFNTMINDGLFPDSDKLYGLLLCIVEHSGLHMILSSVKKVYSCGIILNSKICNLLVFGLWKDGKVFEARRFLDLMLENGWVPDSRTHRLLIGLGSLGRENENGGIVVGSHDSSSMMQDNVSDILVEGLRPIV